MNRKLLVVMIMLIVIYFCIQTWNTTLIIMVISKVSSNIYNFENESMSCESSSFSPEGCRNYKVSEYPYTIQKDLSLCKTSRMLVYSGSIYGDKVENIRSELAGNSVNWAIMIHILTVANISVQFMLLLFFVLGVGIIYFIGTLYLPGVLIGLGCLVMFQLHISCTMAILHIGLIIFQFEDCINSHYHSNWNTAFSARNLGGWFFLEGLLLLPLYLLLGVFAGRLTTACLRRGRGRSLKARDYLPYAILHALSLSDLLLKLIYCGEYFRAFQSEIHQLHLRSLILSSLSVLAIFLFHWIYFTKGQVGRETGRGRVHTEAGIGGIMGLTEAQSSVLTDLDSSFVIPNSTTSLQQLVRKRKRDSMLICNICLDEMKEGEKLSKLECEHIYHYDCVHEWVEKNPQLSCPLCRADIHARRESGGSDIMGRGLEQETNISQYTSAASIVVHSNATIHDEH